MTEQSPQTNPDGAEQSVLDLYRHLLSREPSERELIGWSSSLRRGESFESLFYKFVQTPEFRSKHRVAAKFPPGHYHSPVVDPSTIKAYVDWSGAQKPAAIDISLEEMDALFSKHLAFNKDAVIPSVEIPNMRFRLADSPFPFGDALVLRMFIAEFQPRRIIEIGSGFSTAYMLDVADELKTEVAISCIEPYPERLRSLLRATDASRVSIKEQNLQSVSIDFFGQLEANDFLFIDSTHVLKTGSDVHYELFHILPSLRSGVLVHIHDVTYPFEYPMKWIFEDNYSWNEAYALRAFLMYNSRFRILFWNSFFRRERHHWLAQHFPEILPQNPGGSIWLRVS